MIWSPLAFMAGCGRIGLPHKYRNFESEQEEQFEVGYGVPFNNYAISDCRLKRLIASAIEPARLR